MSKSSKKKRQAVKRKKELEKLRGLSVVDDSSPIKPLQSSPNPLNANAMKKFVKDNGIAYQDENKTVGRQCSILRQEGNMDAGNDEQFGDITSNSKDIEFVLPRSNGVIKPFLFDKQIRKKPSSLPTIGEVETPGLSTGKKNIVKKEETIDEILFPSKRKRLEGKFEAIHREEKNGENEEILELDRNSKGHSKDPPSTPLKKKKKKRRRSSSVDKEMKDRDSNVISNERENPRKLSIESLDIENRQLSGRSVEQAVRDKTGLRPRANSTDGELNLPQRGLCDEQMVLRSHKWDSPESSLCQTIPRGLNNQGNTCFLNATLQCLAYSPPFYQSLVTISKMKAKQFKKGLNTKQSQGQRVTTNLCDLFQRIHGTSENSAKERSISPSAIVKALPKLGNIGSRNGYKFWPGRQEDAHEFLVHLLDAMHDGELRGAGINQHKSGWRDRLPVTRLDETTFIHRIFGGYFRSQVRCKACGYCSNTYDPFLDLSLEVSKKSSRSVLHAIGEFTKKETLDFDNQWKCSGCKKYVCPTKQLTVYRAPLCLCIQLKRFAFGGGFNSFKNRSSFGGGNSFGGRSKITKPIEFPADLDLPLSDGRSCEYALTGVVVHVGGSASSGHYTAYVKKPNKHRKSQWFHADDSCVERVSEEVVLRQKDAYILFYCRKEVKLEFPSLPPREMSAAEAKEFGRARARARADSNSNLAESTPCLPSSMLMKSTEIHPLAAFLNTSMADQFKTNSSVTLKSSHIGKIGNQNTTLPKRSTKAKKITVSNETVEYLTGQEQDKSDERKQLETTLAASLTTAEKLGRTESTSVRSPTDKRKLSLQNREEERMNKNSSSFQENSSIRSIQSEVKASKSIQRAFSAETSRTGDESHFAPDCGSSDDSDPISSFDDTGKLKEEHQKRFELSDSPSTNDSMVDDIHREIEGPGGSRHTTLSDHENMRTKQNLAGSENSSFPHIESEADSGSDKSTLKSNRKEPTGKLEQNLKGTSSASETHPGSDNMSSKGSKDSTGSPTQQKKTLVVVGSADSRGKVRVMMGPKKRKAWVAKTAPSSQKGSAFQLLGNRGISKWDDDDTTSEKTEGGSYSKKEVETAREAIVRKIEVKDNARKRKMYLDRWDAVLDQGRTKKMKQNSAMQVSDVPQTPNKNVFQRIQSGIQRMNKGKAKGLFRRNGKEASSRRQRTHRR